jgi:hypothetical protein
LLDAIITIRETQEIQDIQVFLEITILGITLYRSAGTNAFTIESAGYKGTEKTGHTMGNCYSLKARINLNTFTIKARWTLPYDRHHRR